MQENARSGSMIFGVVAILAVIGAWLMGFYYAPVDMHQGPVYRIIFLHVPSAMAAFAASFGMLIFSLVGLSKRSESSLKWSKAIAEVGVIFTCLALATGSIWGRPTWGTWWTWDARLTTTFLLFLMYVGWLLLYSSLPPGPSRVTVCSVLGILIFVDVPIIYKSVTWWRTLHQPPSMLRPDGASTMEPEMLHSLLFAIFSMLLMAVWLVRERYYNIGLQDEIEAASYQRMRA